MFNINRTGVFNTAVTKYPGETFGKLFPESVDHALVDAPCSGEGMAYKTGEIKSRDEHRCKNLAAIQQQILASAIHACKPGGTIVYSTCTLNTIENEGVIENITKQFEGYITLAPSNVEGVGGVNNPRRFWPHRDHTGGFFVATLQKIASTKHLIKQKKSPVETFRKNVSMETNNFLISKKLQKEISELLYTDFGITIDPTQHLFLATKNKIYLTSPVYMKIHDTIYVQKTGIPLYEIGEHGNYKPRHEIGNILGHLATKNVYDLSDEEADLYAQHKDISPSLIHPLQRAKEGRGGFANP